MRGQSLDGDLSSLRSQICCLRQQITDLEGQIAIGAVFPRVENYSALPDASDFSGAYFHVENSQGTKWLPGPLGGTFYSKGFYYSNGTSWVFVGDIPYNATQAEVDAGVVTDKFVTPNTLANSTLLSSKIDGTGLATYVPYFTDANTIAASGIAWSQTNQTVGIGTAPVANVRTVIRGTGSTSPTTALRVENSNGDPVITALDNRNTYLGQNAEIGVVGSGGGVLALRGYYINTSTTLDISPGGSNPFIRSTGANSFTFKNNSGILFENVPGTVQYAFFRANGGLGVGNYAAYPNTNYVPANGFAATGIGYFGPATSSFEASSILELRSTTQGFLPPRGTTAQMNAIASPAEGLMFYDLDVHKLHVYDGTTWQPCW